MCEDLSGASALAGLRVLDFSHVYQGPVGTQLLADFGAEVIKVERPGSGDWSRAWGPFVSGVSLPFANLNRNKRSLAVDIKSEKGYAIVRKLVESADILVHNFRKGVMEKNGLGYEELKEINPRLVYAWSSGWGDSGPHADSGRSGHDLMARAEAGWFSQKENGQSPTADGISADYVAGLNLMVAILMAIHSRTRTGEGQFVSTDLLSAAFHAHAWKAAAELNADKIDRGAAIGGTEEAIDKAFKTQDGFIEISPVFSDNALRDISLALELGDLSQEPSFVSEALQIQNRSSLNEILAKRFAEKTTEEWIATLTDKNVLCARIQNFDQAKDDPQVLANNMVVEMEHQKAGPLRLLGTPIRLRGTPSELKLPPPDLGEHSRAIVSELGYSNDELDELLDEAVIA